MTKQDPPTEAELAPYRAELKKLEEQVGITLDDAIAIVRNEDESINGINAIMLIGCALKWGLLSEERVREIFKHRKPEVN